MFNRAHTSRASMFWFFALIATLFIALPAHAQPALDPSSVEATLLPGQSIEVTKTVTTPEIPPKPDVFFLADTTGSMGGAIGNVQLGAAAILAAVDAATTDARYGAGDYKDFQTPPSDPYAFNPAAPIPGADDDGAAALAAIGVWSAGGGEDLPEAQLYALHQIAAHGAAAFRTGSTPIVVWFGDAPGHDPVCPAISGDADNVTESSVTAELVAAGIQVIAISTGALDGDPNLFSSDYGICGAPAGAAGQATRIAAATGGAYFPAVDPDEVVDAILDGLTSLPVEVTMESTCEDPISTTFAPDSVTVASGGDAVFTETISVAVGAAPGTYTCRDVARINGELMTDAAGNVIYETKTIHVPGRMTGGGSVFTDKGVRVTHGFQLHCPASDSDSNNLEINWAGNRFHLTELSEAVCSDNPAISEGQPVAGFDTFEGSGTGRLNGEDGHTVEFVFTDAGEPGKGVDVARISIDGGAALLVSGTLEKGNQQAHPN